MLGGLFSSTAGRGILLLLIVLVGGGFFLFDHFTEENDPATYAATLEDMREDFGSEVRVVRVGDLGGGATWEVLTSDDVLVERVYSTETSSSRNPSNGSYTTETERKEAETERKPTARERNAASLTLGDLDPGVIETMCEETGLVETGGHYELRGETWTSGGPGNLWKANFDGTGLKHVDKSATVDLDFNLGLCDLEVD